MGLVSRLLLFSVGISTPANLKSPDFEYHPQYTLITLRYIFQAPLSLESYRYLHALHLESNGHFRLIPFKTKHFIFTLKLTPQSTLSQKWHHSSLYFSDQILRNFPTSHSVASPVTFSFKLHTKSYLISSFLVLSLLLGLYC